MKNQRWLPLLTLVMIVSIVLSACGGAATPPPAPTQPPAAAAEATKAPEPTKAPESARAPQPTKAAETTQELIKLQISDEQKAAWVRNFNPFAPDPLNTAQFMLFEPMFIFNIATGGEPVPWLATEYKYSDDLNSVTFTIRDGVKWSDGEPFTAQDVAFTFNMLAKFPSLDTTGVNDVVEAVEAKDDKTVLFTLQKVYTLAHERIGLVNIVPEHQWSKVEDPVTFTNPEPIGTGPFTEITVFQDQIYEQCKNPHYWQAGKPMFDCIRVPAFAGNEQAIPAMVAGETDWAGHFVPEIEKTYVAADPEHFHYFFAPNDSISLYPNTTKAPFNDVKFRKALSMAIDRAEIVAIATYGYATVNDNATGLGKTYETWYSQDAIKTAGAVGSYAPDEAEKLLDEAGYIDKNGDGKRDMPDGSPLKFKIQVVTGWTDWVNSVQMIAEYFQDIGLDASVDTPEFGAWMNNNQNATFDITFGWGQVRATPWDYYHDAFHSSMIQGGLAQGISWSRWSSPETDKLIDEFVQTTDQARQREIIDQLQAAVVENVPIIPVFSNPGWYEYNTQRFTGWPTRDNYYARGMPFANIADRLLVLTTIEPVK